MSPESNTPSDRHEVDAWRFTGSFLRNMLSKAIPDEPAYGGIPWTPVSKPLSESKVALLTTAGISMKHDEPFDLDLDLKGVQRLTIEVQYGNSQDIADYLHLCNARLLK